MKERFSNASQEEIDDFYIQVSSRVRQLREQRGISQLDLALDIGIKSVAFYSNCECNRYEKHFNLEHIYKLCKAFELSLAEFFEGIKIKEKELF